MNNIFKKANSKMIKLDDNYRLETDGDNGVTLIFSEPRVKINKETRKEEDLIFEDKWYFPRVNQALERFEKLSGNSSKTIEEILANNVRVLKVLEEFSKKFKNWV